jgi:hypothetical protein
VINTAGGGLQKQKCVREDKNEPVGKKVMSCGNLLTHGDVLLHQSQKEFNRCDSGAVSLSNFWK